jgi:hypothetical protein
MRARDLVAAACASAALCAAPAAVQAHFVLQAPASWLEENQIGDPQKLGPCGGVSSDPGKPTGAVTAVTGGSLLHVSILQTVYHPGHFRIALSVLDRAELPPDPDAVTRPGPNGPISVSARIDPTPKPPVLVDGLWEQHQPISNHRSETDLRLPNIDCAHCTLQVIQFMEEHGENPDGRFTYHHCADLKITADPTFPIDRGWPGQGAARPSQRR